MTDTDTWYPEPPKEQQEAEQQQQSRDIASLPVIQETLDWFDEQIATFKDPSTIQGVNPTTNAEDIKAAVLLAQALIQSYEAKRTDYVNRFSRYIEEAADAA